MAQAQYFSHRSPSSGPNFSRAIKSGIMTSPKQFANFGCDIALFDEGFADEDGRGTGLFEAGNVGAGVDAALGNQKVGAAFAGGNEFFREAGGGAEIHFKSFQVAVVDADEFGAEGEGAVELGFVVDFDEDGEAGPDGEIVEAAEAFVIEDGDDEEDGVGTPFDGFEDLAFVDDEVFAEEREGDGGADRAEVIEGALEIFFIREDGEAAGTGGLVFGGDTYGVKVGTDDAGGGGGFLDLGDEADVADAGMAEGGEEVAAFAMLEEGVTQIAGGEAALGEEGDLAFFLFNDFVEDVRAFHK